MCLEYETIGFESISIQSTEYGSKPTEQSLRLIKNEDMKTMYQNYVSNTVASRAICGLGDQKEK